MLQSAIFANLQGADLVSPFASPRERIRLVAGKNSYARFVAWGRSLFIRDEFEGMSAHLMRDIGLI